jgi:hypothetical protein
LVETYVALALAAPGVKADVRPEWTWVTGLSTVSFCNFVARFSLTSAQLDQAIPMFREFGRRANTFWIFVTDVESPGDMGDRLHKSGFEIRQSLKQMAWECGSVPECEPPDEALSMPDRMRVSRFMTETFFNNANGHNRRLVIEATANSPHRLFFWRDGLGLAAAVMVSESAGVYGIYNLCVRQDVRERGYGSDALSFVQSLAADAGRAVVLQCQPEMADWYHRRGFDPVGEMKAFGVPNGLRP